MTGASLAGVVAQRWHRASPATWNRHVTTTRSFARYCERTRILQIDGDVELQRRAERHDHTRSIALASLERLWERRDIDLRERTLWRLLYETAARADEVLRLNVEDLDIPAKRARTRSKGGDVDWLFFGSGSARLLPRLIAGRRAGPVFLSSLRPSAARAPAAGDICPLTGHARLSYRRAAELLVSQTGWTLHQFRHSALTHLAENDVQLPLLMAKSRHASSHNVSACAATNRNIVRSSRPQHAHMQAYAGDQTGQTNRIAGQSSDLIGAVFPGLLLFPWVGETSQRSAHRPGGHGARRGRVPCSTRGHRPWGKRSACYQAGCARATLIAIQRSGAGQSRGGPPGPSAASRAAAPLDGLEKRSYDVPFEHPPRRALQSRNASN
jgi:site-specific recombinase XerD